MNYPNCVNYDAGDCCDPRSVVDHSYARQYNYNNMCHFLGSIVPLNLTNFALMFYNSTPAKIPEDFSFEAHRPNATAFHEKDHDFHRIYMTGTMKRTNENLKAFKRWPNLRYEGMMSRGNIHVPIIREDSNVNRWSAATFAWPKLLSTVAFSQYHKFNTKQSLEMIFPAMRYLKFTNLHSLKNVNMKGARINAFSGDGLMGAKLISKANFGGDSFSDWDKLSWT